ncbi:amidohydrolase family protein [Actinotalea sp. K2]|uniref:N-acyl-D-amino-acid deacylase family protein n=1 Tax=Actinotalea sp. K2 TaxID=2939438 RepID=UPI002017BF02|nr:amidohydrolase family protein [Actinotalea sp. K2]MCL3861725.1 amidohydrolase family protein [Actinotalea sp. K2]
MVLTIRGGTVVDPVDGLWTADVAIDGGRVVAVGEGLAESARLRGGTVLDADGRLVLPGLVDAHSHADARVLDEDVQLALLRQGVTSVLAGQDGVSFAPGDGAYATDYFGPINGPHPTYRGGGVGALLDGYAGTTRVNVGYLVPAGTVRHEVMGAGRDRPNAAQLAAMVRAVEAGLAEGALGLSSGLDYVPGCFADAAELAALCAPVTAAGALYVTHMRGYEESAPRGLAEVEDICRRSGVAAHVSHLHARADLLDGLLAGARDRGLDLTFDAYPYARGFTLLSMAVLPADLVAQGAQVVTSRLRTADGREQVRAQLARLAATPGAGDHLAAGWPSRMRVASAGSAAYAWTEGRTLTEAAASRDPAATDLDATDLALRMLGESALRVTVVLDPPSPRTDAELARTFRHPEAMGGSDGIYLGGHPHPRAWGAFARLLATGAQGREEGAWPRLADLLSLRPVERFGLGARGRVTGGAVADLVLVDPAALADHATPEHPTTLATGIDDVLVAGTPVLTGGALTSHLAGAPLRRSRPGRPTP